VNELVRVSDAERERAIASLRGHLVDGRLTLDDFAERVDAAYHARTAQELAMTAEGLPLAMPRRKPKRITASVFGNAERQGRFRIRRRTLAATLFGNVDLNLREAQIDGDRATVAVLVLFGNIDVYVPEGVDVDVGGLVVFGHLRETGKDTAHPGGAVIRVRAFGLFGSIDVWRVPHGASGGFRELIKSTRAEQRQLES
jgi:hypothetical protein